MDRPNYEIPQEILDSLTDAQIQALRGMPAEQKQQYIDNVMRSQQASLDAMGDRKAGLTGLTQVHQSSIDAYRNMLSMDAQQRQANEKALQNTRGVVAGFKDKEFEYNEALPYEQTMAAGEAMIGAGVQNIMGGVQSGSQMGLDAVMFNQYMNNLGGSGGTNNTVGSPGTNSTVGSPGANNTVSYFNKDYSFGSVYPNSSLSFDPVVSQTPPPSNMGIYSQGQTSPLKLIDYSFGNIYNNSGLSYNPGNTFKLPR